MHFVPNGTQVCGLYECEKEGCWSRFLDTRVRPSLPCPFCGKVVDMEIGPDDPMPTEEESAKLLRVLEDEKEIAGWDRMLGSFHNDDESWI